MKIIPTASFLLSPYDPDTPRAYPRIPSFDLPRAIAIGLMIMIHTLMFYASPTTMGRPLTRLLMLFGTAPGAPTFMFLMGVYFIYARPKSTDYYVRRGLQLIALGYLLNVLRFLVPVGMILLFEVPKEIFLPWTPLTFFKDIDILQFAGLTMIIMAFIRAKLRRPLYTLIIIAVVALAAPHLWGVTSGMAALDWVLDLLWGKNMYTVFPLFPWLAYPLAGYLFGQLMIANEQSRVFFRKACLLGFILYLGGMAISSTNPAFHYGDYFRAGYGGITVMLGFAIFYVTGVELICRRLGVQKKIKIAAYLSDNLTALYIIHWTIIGWLMLTGAPKKLSLSMCFLFMLLVGVLSLGILIVYRDYQEAKKRNSISVTSGNPVPHLMRTSERKLTG